MVLGKKIKSGLEAQYAPLVPPDIKGIKTTLEHLSLYLKGREEQIKALNAKKKKAKLIQAVSQPDSVGYGLVSNLGKGKYEPPREFGRHDYVNF
jgi:hypothetical protein